MKTIELGTTALKNYNLTLCEGKAVVRNQNRINGLIGVRNSIIPEEYHNLLAQATFAGGVVNETIIWTTEVFSEAPRRLSELTGEEFAKYSDILENALRAYAQAFMNAEDSVKKLVYASITYASKESIFCANDKVVVTEWGMSRKGDSAPIGMPMLIDNDSEGFHPNKMANQVIEEDHDSKSKKDETSPESSQNLNDESDAKTDEVSISGNSHDASTTQGTNNEPGDNSLTSNQQGDNTPVDGGDVNSDVKEPLKPVTDKKPKKKCKWWWLLALALLAGLILCLSIKSCKSNGIVPVTPELDSTQVVLSSDSLRYVASNRLLLLITNKETTIDEFEKAFHKKYNADIYILSNPDTIVGRVTLTLPAEERESMEEKLPDEFSKFGLVVIPETIYKNSYESNDPDLGDSNKRWYFEECAVFDAWDVTMGSEDIVVAIIDDGFDLNHPELQGKIVKPYNAVYHTSNVTPSPSGHGTHVAATAVGNADNNQGICGIAPKCKLMPIQVGDPQGTMTTSAILDAVVYAISNGADVVNMSLGMSFGPFVQFAPLYIQKNFRANMFLQEERVWEHLFNIAYQHNVTFVLAGGNENCLIGLDPMQRSQNTIKVSAIQPDEAKASFSNYGDMSTVSAPGVRIFNAVPGNRYTYMDGTSMAAPIVTGGCALLKSHDSNLSVTDLAQILRQTGKQSPSDVGPIVNFAKALNAEYYDSDECEAINERYQELLNELEELRRNHPGCIQKPDTMSIPENISVEQLTGRWKSTTTLINEQEQDVVIYFTFNGSSTAKLDIIEPNGDEYSARLNISISNDQVYIDQTEPARNLSTGKGYNPYKFVLKPNPNRKANGNAKNKIESANMFTFNLIKI